MSRAILFLTFIFCAFAIVSASPFIYVADQTGATLGNSNSWYGFVFAYIVAHKGTPKYRVRIYGENNINDTVTRAYVQTAGNATNPAQIVVSLNTSIGRSNLNYIVGDVFINSTIWQYWKYHQLFVSVASAQFPNGSISGRLTSRPFQAITLMSPRSVVGANVSSLATGIGGIAMASVNEILGTLPTDLIQQDITYLSTLITAGRIIHNVSNATSATWNGPAGTNGTAVALNTFSTVGGSFFLNGTAGNITEAFWLSQGITYLSVQSSSFPGGEIRGQLIPTTQARRKQIPVSITNIYGTSSGSFATLRHANQAGFANHPGSYIRLTPGNVGGSTFQYQGIFNIRTRITKQNTDGVRGFVMEANLRGQGQTYLFEILNANNGTYLTLGTFNGTISWTPVFSTHFYYDAANYIDARGYMRIRVSSVGPRVLLVDQLSLRIYHTRALGAQVLRAYTKFLQHLPSH